MNSKIQDKMKNQLYRYPKTYSIMSTLYYVFCLLKNTITSIPFLFMPIQNKKIVVCNYRGKGYGDNGKYIVDEIIKQNLEYDIVWQLEKDLIESAHLPEQVRSVRYGSLKNLYELATAKIWIDNTRKAFSPIKRKEQYYIQTWHGSLALKKIEKDVESVLSKNYIYNAKRDSKMADLFISNGSHISNLYKSSFWYDGEILESGSPRNDIMFSGDDEAVNERVRLFFNIDAKVKIALYAPTFRKTNDTDVYNLHYSNCIAALSEKFAGEWVILIRLHPNVSYRSNEMKYGNNIYNASLYDDMQELLAVADVLITDYSSSMFDFTLTRKPCFLYVPDVQEYMQDRTFYFNLEDLPFSLGENNDELIREIEEFDQDLYNEKLSGFFNAQGIVEDGMASKRVVERIKEVIGDFTE